MKQLFSKTSKFYCTNFIIAGVLNLTIYALAYWHLTQGWILNCTLGGLGLAQVAFLLFCFLDFNNESKPRWSLLVFVFMIAISTIILTGSIWIMHNIDYNLMKMQ